MRFPTVPNKCPRLVDDLIGLMSQATAADGDLAVGLAQRWQEANPVYRIQARLAWIEEAQREVGLPGPVLADRIALAIVDDQQTRPGLGDLWEEAGDFRHNRPLIERWINRVAQSLAE